VAHRGLWEDDCELVAPDTAGDVGGANDVAYALRDLGQDGIAGEMADPVVDRLEVVQVEDDECEPAPVPLRARDLPRQGLVEVAAVVQAGERVEVGELARLAKTTRVCDRRAGPLGELLELPGYLLVVTVGGGAAEHRQESHRSRLAAHRHREARVDQ